MKQVLLRQVLMRHQDRFRLYSRDYKSDDTPLLNRIHALTNFSVHFLIYQSICTYRCRRLPSIASFVFEVENCFDYIDDHGSMDQFSSQCYLLSSARIIYILIDSSIRSFICFVPSFSFSITLHFLFFSGCDYVVNVRFVCNLV